MAVSWAEAQREAPFKEVMGGFVFRAPGLIAHHYLVSAQQKAEIQRLWRSGPWIVKFVICLGVFGGGSVALQVVPQMLPGSIGQWVRAVVLPLIIGAAMVVEQHLRSSRIQAVLAGARYTNERITWRERAKTLSRFLPTSKIMAIGIFCALISIVLALLLLDKVHGLSVNSSAQREFWEFFAFFVLCAAYCFYLAVLKLRG